MKELNLARPEHVISLATAAVLVSIDMRIWSATKQDAAISNEVTNSKKAERSAGRFTKHLLADNPEHKAIMNYRGTMHQWLKTRTYPWAAGQYCLPAINIPRFMQEYADHEENFKSLVDKFISKYPGIVSNMAFVQGDMFDRNEYPTAEEARKLFRLSMFTSEVPQGDFRVQLAPALAEDLHNHYTRESQTLIRDIVTTQAQQLVDVMQAISHTCTVETLPDGKVKRNRIHTSTIKRALELCDTVKNFNVGDDVELATVADKLEQALYGCDGGIEADSKRTAVKNDVDSILSKFRVRV